MKYLLEEAFDRFIQQNLNEGGYTAGFSTKPIDKNCHEIHHNYESGPVGKMVRDPKTGKVSGTLHGIQFETTTDSNTWNHNDRINVIHKLCFGSGAHPAIADAHAALIHPNRGQHPGAGDRGVHSANDDSMKPTPATT